MTLLPHTIKELLTIVEKVYFFTGDTGVPKLDYINDG